MRQAIGKCKGFSNARQRLVRISQQPFDLSANVSGTHSRIVSTVDEPMVTMLIRIVELASCVSVPTGLRQLAQVEQT